MSKLKEKLLIVFNESGSHTMDLISKNEQELHGRSKGGYPSPF